MLRLCETCIQLLMWTLWSFSYNPLEVSTFPIVVIFFRGCVSEMVVLSYSVIYYIYISGTQGPCFNYWCSVYWCSVYFICLQIKLSQYHHYALIWRHWTNKMLVRLCCRVCVEDWDYSRSYPSFNIWGYVSSAYPILLWWLWECVFYFLSSSNGKYESLTIV